MRRLLVSVAVWLAVTGLFDGVPATVIHVPLQCPTIQAGIDAAFDGDTVLVADGTYTGEGNRDLDFDGKAIVVMSEEGPEETTIDCQGSLVHPHRGFYFHSGESLNSVVLGLTIRNGCSYAVSWDRYGGAIYCSGASPTIANCLIVENTANLGGGISCAHSSPRIAGCTFSGNHADLGGGIECRGTSSTVVVNCILWGDVSSEIYVVEGCSITVSYSDVEGGWIGEGNIDADPLFVSGPHGDHYLSEVSAGQLQQSPCVDAGDPSSAVPEATTRVDEGCDVWPVDMGYHYRQCTFEPVSLLWVQVIPDTTQVRRGEDLWFAVDIVSLTDTTLMFDAWVNGYLPGGEPYSGNPVLGPVELVWGGGFGVYGVRRHVSIPQSAPFGGAYTLSLLTGEHPDSVWAGDGFEFAIVPPPLE